MACLLHRIVPIQPLSPIYRSLVAPCSQLRRPSPAGHALPLHPRLTSCQSAAGDVCLLPGPHLAACCAPPLRPATVSCGHGCRCCQREAVFGSLVGAQPQMPAEADADGRGWPKEGHRFVSLFISFSNGNCSRLVLVRQPLCSHPLVDQAVPCSSSFPRPTPTVDHL